jgi:antitoxin HigA-1
MKPLKLTVSDLAKKLKVSRKTLSKIVNKRGAVTPEMAVRLSRAFKTTPQLWLGLQQNHDLWHAFHDSKGWKTVKAVAA